MSGKAALTDNPSPAPPQPPTLTLGFLPVSTVPLPPGGQPWGNQSSVLLGRGLGTNLGIPGGFLASEFQNQGEQEELMFVTKLLTESKPPASGGAPGRWGTERRVWGKRPPAWG